MNNLQTAQNNCDINNVTIAGQVGSDFDTFKTRNDVEMIKFTLESPRLSGTIDNIPIIVPVESAKINIVPGTFIIVKGSFRSRNEQTTDGARHLVLHVFTRDIDHSDPEARINEIILAGSLCKDVNARTTPKGRRIADMLLACQRKTSTGQSDYLPIIAWGNLADQMENHKVGDRLSFKGRIQSRIYNKTSPTGEVEERTAYEVSMLHLI